MADSTDVRIVISAITEAAEQAIEQVGDELTGIADDAGIGQAALDELGDELSESAGAAELLQTAIDQLEDAEQDATVATYVLQSAQESLGDELSENTAKAGAASQAFNALSVSSEGASVSFGILSSATLLSLIPALLTLSTILAPLVVTFGALAAGAAALAGAFGLVVGSGILAFGQRRAEQNKQRLEQVNRQIEALEDLQDTEAGLTDTQEDRLEQLKEQQDKLEDATSASGALEQVMGELKAEITPLIAEFGQEFLPLVEDAIGAIPTLVRRMLDAVGSTDEFKAALRDFGAIMMDVLPALVGLMFDVARTALPYLREFTNFLLNNGDDALSAVRETLVELEPEFRALLDALIDAAPVVLEFGTNLAEDLLPVLTDLIRAATGFMETINDMPGPIQGAANALLLALPLLLRFSGLLTALIPSAYNLGRAVGAIRVGFSALGGVISGSIAAAASAGAVLGGLGVKLLDMIGVFDGLNTAGARFRDLLGGGLTDAILSLSAVLSGGLLPLIAATGAAIVELVRGDLDGAVQAFNRVLGTFSGAMRRTFDRIVNQSLSWGRSLIQRFTSGVTSFNFRQFGTRLFNRLKQQIQRLINQAQQWGRDIASGIADGIASAPGNIGGAIANRVSDAVPGGLLDTGGNLHAVENVLSPTGAAGTTARADTGADSGLGGTGSTPRGQSESTSTVVQGGLNVNVDTGDFGRNPRRDSRVFADQLRRELRNQNGTT